MKLPQDHEGLSPIAVLFVLCQLALLTTVKWTIITLLNHAMFVKTSSFHCFQKQISKQTYKVGQTNFLTLYVFTADFAGQLL